MSEKKYTFEDWVNDQEPLYGTYFPELDDTIPVGKSGFYPDVLKNRDMISDEEFEKIRNEQKRVYDLVVNHHKQKQSEELHKNLKDAPSKERYLRQRKSVIESKLHKADPDILSDVYSGNWSPYRIDSFTYRKIIKREQEGKPPKELMGLKPSFLSHIGPVPDPKMPPDWNNIVLDEHFKLTILYQELIEIEQLLRKIEGNIVTNEPTVAGGLAHKDFETAEVSKRAIYNRYHQLYDNGLGMKQTEAYKQVEDWLINDVGLTKEEVKEKFSITLEFDSFTRGARNNRKVNE